MSHGKDEVVISGVGGFFPKAENFERFKEVLLSKESLLETRWKEGERGLSNRIGKCPTIEYFDTAFFGIHRQQATFMDPMQRLILERTFECLVDAGVNPQDVRGKRIGCYMGSSIGENDNLFYESIVSGFGVTGHSRAMMANRVSYWLNLKGPSCAYDSNWINGIEVLQMGFDAVREGHCEAAIVGTANLALNSEVSWLYDDMGLLSADGSTKAFDAEASGYARSDGIIVMYIQRAEDAKRAYATIVGTSTEFNGCREGTLLDIDQKCMTTFLKDFYDKCDVDPRDVDFVECYGAAIKSMDEAELNSIDEVYCKNRKTPLMIGSVKTNCGHSEASSNLISIAKVLVAMETGKIPATLQYNKPNPNIAGLVNGRMEVVTDNRDWDGDYAAINGLGLSSSYAHCLLKSNRKKKALDNSDKLPRLIVASTRTETGIEELLNTVRDHTPLDNEYVALTHELFKKSISGHLYRGYSILSEAGETKRESEYHTGNKRQTWFIFSGMGSQWCGMGRDLMNIPMFADTIMKCHRALEPHGVDLLTIITRDDPKIFDNILHSFVGIAAIQIALTDILKALGVTPDGILGHSVGELGCAYADGCLSAEQMIMCAYSRGRASLEVELIPGMMAAIGLGYNQIKNQCPESIEVACHNGPESSTISGPREDMEVFVKQLQDRGVFARLVNVANIAYHSRYIKPAAPYLLKYLKEVIPEPVARSSKWVSSSVHEKDWDSPLAQTSSAEYHTNNLLSSVLFEEGSTHIPKDSVCIEIAPHGLLQAILKKSLKSGCTNIPLTQRGSKDGIQFLLGAIGKMYLAGLDVNVTGIYPKIEYPVSKGTCGLAPLVHWEHGEMWRTGIDDKLNYLVSVREIRLELNNPDYKDCIGHLLDDRIIFPLSSTMTEIIKILATSKSMEISEVIFENIRFRSLVELPKGGYITWYAMVQKGTGEFEIQCDNKIIATGRVYAPQANETFMLQTYDLGEEDGSLGGEEVYAEFLHRGHKYDGVYKNIKRIDLHAEGSKAVIDGCKTWQDIIEAMLQLNLYKQGEKYQDARVPMLIQRMNISIPNIPITNDEVILEYDYNTGIISTTGVQLCGLTSQPLPINPKQISYNTIEFVPFTGAICDNMETVINYAINITITNFTELLVNSIVIIEIASKQSALTAEIRRVAEKYTQMNANVTTVSDPKDVAVSQTDPVIIISNEEAQEYTLKAISTNNAFLLAKTGKNLLSQQNVITVAEFTVGATKYSLLRKVQNKLPKLIKLDRLNVDEILKVAKAEENCCLVVPIIPPEGVLNFVANTRAEFKNLKYLFVLEKNAPEVSIKDAFYKRIFERGNILSVMQDGKVGTYVALNVDFKANIKNSLQLSRLHFKANYNSNDGDIKENLAYVGVNTDNEGVHAENVGLGNVDYVSVDKNGFKIMGLSKFDDEKYNLKPDPVLKWNVPDDWSLEDACTVPHAYTIAYNCLLQKGRLEPGSSVLIHSGCTAIGLAAISIAASMGCNVFTTVATDWQKSFLRKQFTCLKDRNILSLENSTFEAHLLTATCGAGVQVILNTQTDTLLNCSLRCLSEYGRLIQLAKFDKTQNNSIGMSIFLKNTCVMGAIPENIFALSPEDKQELQNLVQEGINKSVVRPLHRKVVEHQHVADILRDLKAKNHIGKILIKLNTELILNQLNVKRHNQFICATNSAHLILGGSSELLVDMIEWLVLRGAQRIMVLQKLTHNRRLNLMKHYFGAEIIQIQDEQDITKNRAVELISELYGYGPIQGVYILPGQMQIVQNIDQALRTAAPKAFIVNFDSEVAGMLQVRNNVGFQTYNVQWDDNLDFGLALYSLDDIMSFRVSNIFINNDRISEAETETPQALYKKLTLLLPTVEAELLKSSSAPNEPELIQLPSSGPRRIREVPPVILVPGFSAIDTVKDFAKQLLYPIFYTQLPNRLLEIEDAGKIFAEKIRKLHPRGPYNLIGISTGGVLAVEIAGILQTFANTQVTLIDGAPDTIQESIKYLGAGASFEVNLLNRILNIGNTEVLKDLSAMSNWDKRLFAALDSKDISEDDKTKLSGSLTLLRDNLKGISAYRAGNKLLKGDLHLFRPTGSCKTDNCGLLKYFEKDPVIYISNGDHLSILKAENTIDIINEKVTVV